MSRNGIAPLPSFIRASSTDAGNMHMRKYGRTKWNDDDWNRAVEVQDRLVIGCYGRGRGDNRPEEAFYRFQIASQLERAGKLNSASNIAAEIDAVLNAPAEAEAA